MRKIVLFLFLSIISIGAQSANSVKIDFPVVKFKLPSGMTVLLAQNNNIPMISYQTWFRVGSRDELPGESGLAHMLEHMMFKGAEKYSNKDFDRILHENGITNNAFTTFDYTGYYENLPSSKLELIMDIEVDRLQSLALASEELVKELEVVKEERRMRVDNNPQGLAWELMFKAMFEKHRYGIPVIGTMKDITGYKREMLKKFFTKWYKPSNAVLIIVGDFDIEKTKKLVEKYYGVFSADPVPKREVIVEPAQIKERLVNLSKPIKAPLAMVAWPAPKSGTDDAYALDLLAAILGDGKSSRLFQRLTYQDQTAIYVGAGNYGLQEYGVFYISANLKPGQSAEKASQSIQIEIDKVKKQKVSAVELQKVKNQTMAGYVNSIRTIDGKARMLATNEILFGDYSVFFKDLDRYNKVTVDDLYRVANKYLSNEKRTLVYLKSE